MTTQQLTGITQVPATTSILNGNIDNENSIDSSLPF
jgi:hypothetical protein